MQHLSHPIYERAKGRLLIEVDAVAGVNNEHQQHQGPINESIGDFIARYNHDPGTERRSTTPYLSTGTVTCQCDGTGAHRGLLGPDSLVDTLVAEDIDREGGNSTPAHSSMI